MNDLNLTYINMDKSEKQNDEQKIQVSYVFLVGWHLMMDDDKFMKSKLIEDCPLIMGTKK